MALKKTIKRIALFFLCLLGGCEQPNQAVTTSKEHVVISSSGTHYLGRLVAVEFENHKWIFVSGTESANVVHHPDCACKGDK